LDRLTAAGYAEISTPFRVASVSFDFTAALRGRDGRALDLVLLVDTTTGDFGDRDASRIRSRIEALSRALDVTGSRYVVTLVLAGAPLAGDVEAITENCRVLLVEALPTTDDGQLEPTTWRLLEDRIRVLLPLEIPEQLHPAVAEGGAVEMIVKALPATIDAELVARVVSASEKGEEAVTEAVSEVIGNALQIAGGEK
jgi:hypothetical protein